MSIALLVLFGDSIAGDVPASFDRLTLPAFILGGLALVSSLLPPRYWLAGIAPFGGMVALTVLFFTWWLHAGIALGAAMLSAITLNVLVAFVLGHYLQLARYRRLTVSPNTNRWLKRFTRRRTVRSGPIRCSHCKRPNHPAAQDCNSCGLPQALRSRRLDPDRRFQRCAHPMPSPPTLRSGGIMARACDDCRGQVELLGSLE